MSENNRPPDRPTCCHGNSPQHCKDCAKMYEEARQIVKPLEDQYWSEKGQNGLDHLFVRAFLLGAKESSPLEDNESHRDVLARLDIKDRQSLVDCIRLVSYGYFGCGILADAILKAVEDSKGLPTERG